MRSAPNLTLMVGMVLMASACSISPLQSRIDVGEEPFLVFVAEGSDNRTDLFASLPGGGELARFTFTELRESSPRLTRHGGLVAFLRERSSSELDAVDVVVMNLLSGAERRITLPDSAGMPTLVGWDAAETGLYVRTETAVWWVNAPPLAPEPSLVPAADMAHADSALMIVLGSPTFGRVIDCEADGVCVRSRNGVVTQISDSGRDGFRWGSDSLGWFEDGAILVRSLGPGSPRQLEWREVRHTGAREGSYAEAGLGSN